MHAALDGFIPLAVPDLDPESGAGPLLGDGDDDLTIALTPEQPDVEVVVGAVVEFADRLSHDLDRGGGVVRTDGESVRVAAQ